MCLTRRCFKGNTLKLRRWWPSPMQSMTSPSLQTSGDLSTCLPSPPKTSESLNSFPWGHFFSYLSLSHMHTRVCPESLLCNNGWFCNCVNTLLLTLTQDWEGVYRETEESLQAYRPATLWNIISMAASCSAMLCSMLGAAGWNLEVQEHLTRMCERGFSSFQYQVCVLIVALHQAGRRARLRDLPSLRCRLWLSSTTTTLRCGAWAGTSPARCWPPLGTTAAWDSGKVRFRH